MNIKFIPVLLPVALVACMSGEELKQSMEGSWAYDEPASRLSGCFTYQQDQSMRAYIQTAASRPPQYYFGFWHPLRGMRLQQHIGLAQDHLGNKLAVDEINTWRRLLFTISDLTENTYTMHSENGDSLEVRRVENCDAYRSRFKQAE